MFTSLPSSQAPNVLYVAISFDKNDQPIKKIHETWLNYGPEVKTPDNRLFRQVDHKTFCKIWSRHGIAKFWDADSSQWIDRIF